MREPADVLDIAFRRALENLENSIVSDPEIADRIESVCHNESNRSCVRVLLACSLAKICQPEVDIRKPYTQIGSGDCYSGRTYDESYITQFIVDHSLPCNPTTGFLTPAFRNMNTTLTLDLEMVGRPEALYENMLQLFDYVYRVRITADDLLAETVRCLINFRDQRAQLLDTMLNGLISAGDVMPLSAEAIITLIQQHLDCPRASRLPVLVVAAAYQTAEEHLGERVLPLQSHTAADEQTGALGDLDITLVDDDNVITSYEMKMRRVECGDIDRALQKIEGSGEQFDNYIFITTDEIDDNVAEYAATMYEITNGIEFVVLDCIGFLRYFLHLFHRLRGQFLDTYQRFLLEESESSVRQGLKEAFLGLRRAAESAVDF